MIKPKVDQQIKSNTHFPKLC